MVECPIHWLRSPGLPLFAPVKIGFVLTPPCSSREGVYGIAGLSIVGCDPAAFMQAIGSSFAGPAVKLAVSFPLIYHYLGAVRHMVSHA